MINRVIKAFNWTNSRDSVNEMEIVCLLKFKIKTNEIEVETLISFAVYEKSVDNSGSICDMSCGSQLIFNNFKRDSNVKSRFFKICIKWNSNRES